MKTRLIAAAVVTSACTVATAEVERNIPLGIEAVAGYRSEYIQRGFKWANDVVDFQAEAEVSLSNDVIANIGAWYATSASSGNFDERAAFARIRREQGDLTFAFETTWRTVSSGFFNDGLDLSPTVTWHINRDLQIVGGLAWDTGADGLYAYTEGRWSHPLNKSAFVSANAGVSWVDGYYDRSGMNDLYGRVSYTQVFSQSISLTPFLGTSIPLQSDTETTRLFGGIWFEVNF